MIKFKAVIILLLISSTSFGLDTNSIKYMPLHVGDYWVYNSGAWSLSGSNYWISKCSVTSSIVYNNHLYYYLYSSNVNLLNGYFRTDSLTGSLLQYDPSNSCVYYYYEKLFDSLSASIGDSTKNCAPYKYKCTGIVPIVIFGDSTNKINFYDSYQGPNSGNNTTKVFVKKYGLYSLGGSAWGGGGFGGWGNTLKGCKINGIRYGDTSLTSSINTISSTIPASYILNQNYPNPFNPTTKIKFSVVNGFPTGAFGNDKVVLKVYDVMGREVQTLVNERLQPGTYEAAFDGSSLNTGVYFYKLITGTFSETKKMLLIK